LFPQATQAPFYNEYPDKQIVAAEVDEQLEAPPGHSKHYPETKVYPVIQAVGVL